VLATTQLHPPKNSTNPPTPTHSFVLGRPLVTSAVIGATSVEQLREQLGAARDTRPLEPGLLSEIDAVHAELPNPAP